MPGSGKAVLGRAAADILRARGVPIAVLELDAIHDVQGHVTVVDAVQFLVDRLHRSAAFDDQERR